MPQERIKFGNLRPGDLIHQHAGYVLILDVEDAPALDGLCVRWLEVVTNYGAADLRQHEATGRPAAVFSWTGRFLTRGT